MLLNENVLGSNDQWLSMVHSFLVLIVSSEGCSLSVICN